jgi:hypothetical protein
MTLAVGTNSCSNCSRFGAIYADIPSGGSLNLGQITRDGNVSIWGTASRDPQIGAPVGKTYMDSLVNILPDADIKDSCSARGDRRLWKC